MSNVRDRHGRSGLAYLLVAVCGAGVWAIGCAESRLPDRGDWGDDTSDEGGQTAASGGNPSLTGGAPGSTGGSNALTGGANDGGSGGHGSNGGQSGSSALGGSSGHSGSASSNGGSGNATSATGGAATGGLTSSAGQSSGGVRATGGVSTTGGVGTTGGSPSHSGGASPTGGTSSTGGSVATTGGAAATGGVSSSGGAGANLLKSSGFEGSSTDGWRGRGTAVVTVSKEQYHSGVRSLKVTGRTAAWNGAEYDVVQLLTPGDAYDVTAWARLAPGSETSTLMLTREVQGCGSITYVQLSTVADATDAAWTELSGTLTIPSTCAPTKVLIYVESSSATASYYVDDTSMQKQ